LTVLSEEEEFQQSVAWDEKFDFYLVQAIQHHVIENKSTYAVDQHYSIDVEY
jgi:hypothetical protein